MISRARLLDGTTLDFNFQIRTKDTFDPRCDVCQANLSYVERVFRELETICIFTDKIPDEDTITIGIQVFPIVVLSEINYHTVVEYLAELFHNTILDAHIDSIEVTELNGDLIDEWTF